MAKKRSKKKLQKKLMAGARASAVAVSNKLITTPQASVILGFTKDYIRRMCWEGKIKAEKVGNNWLMYERDILHITRQRKKREA